MSARLVQAWSRTLRRCGDARAIVEAATGASATFRELDVRAGAWLVQHAPDATLVRGRAVVFAAPNGIDWLAMFVAFARAGAVIVPLDAAEPPAQQRRSAEALRAGFWWDGGKLVALNNARRFRDPAICVIKLTSGTTGAPRPLVFTDAQMLADGRQVSGSMGVHAGDLNYAVIPFGHAYGLGSLVVPLIARGIPLVSATAPLPQAIAHDFTRWRPTVWPGVPAVFRALAAADVPANAFDSLRLAISAGAPLPPDVAREFFARYRRKVQGFYGSSETGGIAFDRSGAATLAGGVGRPLRGVRVTLLRNGQLRVCSAAVFTHGNRRRAGAHGCWVPPDLAKLDARGQITLLGRRGSMVKIGGRRLNLGEVTARLRALAGVKEAWVGVDGGHEPVLGAAVVSARPAGELRAALLADTAPWKVPKRWAVLPEFPLTARGKVDTRALQAAVFR